MYLLLFPLILSPTVDSALLILVLRGLASKFSIAPPVIYSRDPSLVALLGQKYNTILPNPS